ncbi:MAG TPA: DNA mismatch repair protein MutS [Thermoanaerobaculia bacterium]|nr:DNA mismatch repair protein MutS [Thermoanaerobaculia bacterium]
MTPRELYAERLAARQGDAKLLQERERTISIVRLVAIAAAIAIVFFSVLIALAPLALFIVLVVMHERVIRARRRMEHGAAFYERGLARLDGSWPGRGDAGEDFADDHHPYSGDFDLFGRASLFELISLAVTRAGRRLLADWLRVPARDPHEIRARQTAVLELREGIDLREDLAIVAGEVAREVEDAKLDGWAAMPPVTFAPWERFAALVLPAIGVVTLLLALPSLFARMVGMTHPEAAGRFGALADMPLWPFVVAIVAILILSRHLGGRVAQIITGVERAEPALALLTRILGRLERESFSSERLARLTGAIRGASASVDVLRKRVALLDARRNQFFAPIGGLLMWSANLAFAIERWRQRNGRSIVDWIATVAELEALSSLASFAFEHPSFAMPEIVERGPLFDARDLGHPLIPDDRRVTNDLRLDGSVRLLVVSGSNMSGKSTMMRSTGIAAVLAMAGSAVCARSLTIAPTQVGASIRIHDSLQENASRFYAEILRIRQVLDMSREGPLLFLLDEVLAGTNSHDRRIGAEAIARALVERGAIGMVSTHDLALASIAEANVHFEDHLEEGRVVFDYRMRPGVVTKSNALELMRSVGIEV